jgi:hypothetical protein
MTGESEFYISLRLVKEVVSLGETSPGCPGNVLTKLVKSSTTRDARMTTRRKNQTDQASVTFAIAAGRQPDRKGFDVSISPVSLISTSDHIGSGCDALRKGMTKYTDVRASSHCAQPSFTNMSKSMDCRIGGRCLISCGAKHSLYNVFCSRQFWRRDPHSGPSLGELSDMALLAGHSEMIQTNEASGFRITAEQLAAELTPKTKVFVLNSPCNPTGASYAADELLAIARVLRNMLLGHADDIYEKIVYDIFRFITSSPNPALRDRTVIINGV